MVRIYGTTHYPVTTKQTYRPCRQDAKGPRPSPDVALESYLTEKLSAATSASVGRILGQRQMCRFGYDDETSSLFVDLVVSKELPMHCRIS